MLAAIGVLLHANYSTRRGVSWNSTQSLGHEYFNGLKKEEIVQN